MIYDPNMARWPAMVTGHTNDRRPVDIAYAALVEAGRPDLALLIVWYDDDDCGGYLEVNDQILTEDDWDLVDKAEVIARAFIDLPPLDRPAWTTVGVAIIHGERDDSEMCLCGAPDYLTCPDWIAGNGTVSSLTFTSATCYYSLGHRNRHQCDCVCVRPAGHDGPHQCSAEAVRP